MVEERHRNVADDDPRQEERQDHRGLVNLQPLLGDFVEQDGHGQREYGRHEHVAQVVQHRVPRDPKGVFALEQELEVFEADPFASQNALVVHVIFESDNYAEHRDIRHDENVDDRGKRENKQFAVPAHKL
ncbi:hypothetical protein [Cohnella rhizosphaerae]|uniref:hypothetical protein n=1 Tax=Cohnella rhizosphaerae TaxID=1457232 RepID=UPI0030B8EFB6